VRDRCSQASQTVVKSASLVLPRSFGSKSILLIARKHMNLLLAVKGLLNSPESSPFVSGSPENIGITLPRGAAIRAT
jgi:hypothetical protein